MASKKNQFKINTTNPKRFSTSLNSFFHCSAQSPHHLRLSQSFALRSFSPKGNFDSFESKVDIPKDYSNNNRRLFSTNKQYLHKYFKLKVDKKNRDQQMINEKIKERKNQKAIGKSIKFGDFLSSVDAISSSRSKKNDQYQSGPSNEVRISPYQQYCSPQTISPQEEDDFQQIEQVQNNGKLSPIDFKKSDSQSQSSSPDSPFDEHIEGQKGFINLHIQPQTRSLHFQNSFPFIKDSDFNMSQNKRNEFSSTHQKESFQQNIFEEKMNFQKNLDQDYDDQNQNQFGILFSDLRINKPQVIEQTNESLQTNEEVDRFSTYEQQDVFLCFSPHQEREKVSPKVIQSFSQTDGQQTEEIYYPNQNCRNCQYFEKLMFAFKQEAQSFHSSISSQQTNFTVIPKINQLFANIIEEMKLFHQYSNLNQLVQQDSKNESFEGSQISFDYWLAERELRLQEYSNQFKVILAKILQIEQYNIHHIIKKRKDNILIDKSNLSAINNFNHDKQESKSLQLSNFSLINQSLDQDEVSNDFSYNSRLKIKQISTQTTRNLNLREQIQIDLDNIFDECIDKEVNKVKNIKRVWIRNKNNKKLAKSMIKTRDMDILLAEKQRNSPQSLKNFPLFKNFLDTNAPILKGKSLNKNNLSSRTIKKLQKIDHSGNSSDSAIILTNLIKPVSKKVDQRLKFNYQQESQANQANQSTQNQDTNELISQEQNQFINSIYYSEIQQKLNFQNQENFKSWLDNIKFQQIQDSFDQEKIKEVNNLNYDLQQYLTNQDLQISLNKDFLKNNKSAVDAIKQKTQVTVSSKNNRPKIVQHKIIESDPGTALRKIDSPIQEQFGEINKQYSESESNSQKQSAKEKTNIDQNFILFENYDYEIHRQETDEIYQSQLGSQKSYFENQTFLGSACFDQQSFEQSLNAQNSNFLFYNQQDENIYDQNLRLVFRNRYNPSTQEQKYGITIQENSYKNKQQKNYLRTFQSSEKSKFLIQNFESLSNQEAPYNQNESRLNHSRFQSFYNKDISQNLFGLNQSSVTKEISCKVNSAKESSTTLSNHFQQKTQNFGKSQPFPPFEYITKQQTYQDKLQGTEDCQQSKPRQKERERASSYRLKPKTSGIKFKEHESQGKYFIKQIETNSQNCDFDGSYQSPIYNNEQIFQKKYDYDNYEKPRLQVNTSLVYLPHKSPTPKFTKEKEIQIIEEQVSDNDKLSNKPEVDLPFNQLAAGSVNKETIRPRANTSPAEWNLNFHTRTVHLRDRSSSGGLNSSKHKEHSQHILHSSTVIEEEDEGNNFEQQNSEKSTHETFPIVQRNLLFQAHHFGKFGPSKFGQQNLYRTSTIKQPSKGPFVQASPIQNTQIPQIRAVGYPYALIGRGTLSSQMKNQLGLKSIPNCKILKVPSNQKIVDEIKSQYQSDMNYNQKPQNYQYIPNNYINLANNYLLVQLPNQQNQVHIQHPSFKNDVWDNIENIKDYYPNNKKKDIAEKLIENDKLQQFQQNNQIFNEQDSCDQVEIQECSVKSIQEYTSQKKEPQSANTKQERPQSSSMVENDFMSIHKTPKQTIIGKFDCMQSNDAKYNDKNIGSNLRCGLKSKTPTKALVPSLQKQNKEIKVEKIANQDGRPSVSFIKIYRHEPTRRNINDNLIDWQNEVTYDYRFSKYLEQNRFERLFSNSELLGEGGFGKVYKVLHGLDNRYYAIKEIPIHLGLLQNFTEHSVYREILAISQVMHTNVVRYHACWIESASPREDKIKKAVKKIEADTKKKWRARKAEALIDSTNKDLQAVDNKLYKASYKIKLNASKQILKEQNSFKLTSESQSRCDQKSKQKNLLKKIEQDSDMTMDANWQNHISSSQASLLTLDKEQNCKNQNKNKNKKKNLLDSENSESSSSELESSSSDESSSDESSSESSSNSSNSSSDSDSPASESNKKSPSSDQNDDSSSSDINEKFAVQLKKVQGKLYSNSSQFSKKEKFSKRKQQIEISEEESEDDDESDTLSVDSTSSLYELISKGQDFITLNVMIQMEFCKGDTLRAILDQKDYYVNRKRVFNLFKQLILGLMHIHGEGLIHRDIKPANIFIDKTRMVLKIGDFGLAKQSNFNVQFEQEIQDLKRNKMSCADLQLNGIKTVTLDKNKIQANFLGQRVNSAQQIAVLKDQRKITKEMEASICAGTPMYQAPEQTIKELMRADNANEPINRLTEKVDMYAAGLILYEMCSNFKTQHSRITAFDLLKTQRQLPQEFNQMNQEREIILNLTDPDPRKRSSAQKLLEDKIFTNWSFEMKEETFMKSENKQVD